MNRFSLFHPGDSPLHRLDPRTKLAIAVTALVLALTFNHPLFLLAVLVLIGVLAATARVPIRRLLGFLWVLVPVLLGSLILWPLFETSGRVLFRLGFVHPTDKGVLFALAIALRIIIPVFAILLLFMTTRRRDIVAGTVKLGLPYKAGFGITIAFGLLPSLVGTGQTIMEAQRARALELDRGNPIRRLRKSARVVVPLMMTAIGSIQNLAFSLDSRGYGAQRKRTYLHEPRYSAADAAVLVLLAAILATAITLRVTGHGAVFTDRI
jgi:energy-coupling factor transport system permease protein